MKRIALLAVASAAALTLAVQSLAAGAATKLKGTVGPGFTITLKDAKGKTVKALKAGKYTIAVADKSNIHNWVLEGPGLKKGKEVTSTPFVGSKTATVTLKKGTYTYVCTPHRSTMKATFKVS